MSKGATFWHALVAVMDIANPSEEHSMLRSMIRDWVEENVEPQAFHHDKNELFNLDLLKSMFCYLSQDRLNIQQQFQMFQDCLCDVCKQK